MLLFEVQVFVRFHRVDPGACYGHRVARSSFIPVYLVKMLIACLVGLTRWLILRKWPACGGVAQVVRAAES